MLSKQDTRFNAIIILECHRRRKDQRANEMESANRYLASGKSSLLELSPFQQLLCRTSCLHDMTRICLDVQSEWLPFAEHSCQICCRRCAHRPLLQLLYTGYGNIAICR